MTDLTILSARRARGYRQQNLHQIPLVLLKRVLLEILGRWEELFQQQPLGLSGSEVVLVVPATKPYPPLELLLTSSLLNQSLRVMFDTSKQAAKRESALSFTLQLCARCGESVECSCGWRRQHGIAPEMEQQNVLEFIASNLVNKHCSSFSVDQFAIADWV